MEKMKITCSDCDWSYTGSEMDCENAFTQHVEDKHVVHKKPKFNKNDVYKNIEISVPNAKGRSYSINIGGSPLTSIGRHNVLDHPDLLEDGDKNIYDEDKAVETATRIAHRLGFKKIYVTIFNYPDTSLVRIIKVPKQLVRDKKLSAKELRTSLILHIPDETGETYTLEVGKNVELDNVKAQELIEEFTSKGFYRKDESILQATRIGVRLGVEKIFVLRNGSEVTERLDV